jgi:UDP-N-acetylmuramate dehydrogenase
MDWLRDFEADTQRDVALGRMTWFRLGGPGRFLARPSSVEQLAALVRRARDAGVDCRVLGAGANVLVRDEGFDGLVIRLDHPIFKEVRIDGTSVEAGAGVDLMPLARRLSSIGLSGMEGLAGIPATVGGAVRMNAGGRFGEFSDVVREITVLDRDGRVERWPRERIGFGYRRSAVGDRVVLSAQLGLSREDPMVSRERFEEYFGYKLRTQPMAEHTAGCVFKNPPGQSAGRLIDQAGLKGAREGAASVSSQHANFIVGESGATASDVLMLIDRIRDRVRRVWGTELEVEIDIW